MAAAVKNSEPMVALSRALTGEAWDSKLPISAGKSQQTAPATAKTMARIILIGTFSFIAHEVFRFSGSLWRG
jgi:hypothetical protein